MLNAVPRSASAAGLGRRSDRTRRGGVRIHGHPLVFTVEGHRAAEANLRPGLRRTFRPARCRRRRRRERGTVYSLEPGECGAHDTGAPTARHCHRVVDLPGNVVLYVLARWFFAWQRARREGDSHPMRTAFAEEDDPGASHAAMVGGFPSYRQFFGFVGSAVAVVLVAALTEGWLRHVLLRIIVLWRRFDCGHHDEWNQHRQGMWGRPVAAARLGRPPAVPTRLPGRFPVFVLAHHAPVTDGCCPMASAGRSWALRPRRTLPDPTAGAACTCRSGRF